MRTNKLGATIMEPFPTAKVMLILLQIEFKSVIQYVLPFITLLLLSYMIRGNSDILGQHLQSDLSLKRDKKHI